MKGHRIFETQDGSKSLFSERFGVSYHSKYGAWQETQHVFVDAGLRHAAIDQSALSVLDIGYGTGLNAIAALCFAEARRIELHYVGVEAYPVPLATIEQLDYPAALDFSASQRELYHQLQAIQWPGSRQLLPKIHVEKINLRFEELAYRERFDVIFYDAFAPQAQPELWTTEQFVRMYAACRPGGLLVTYCAKGQVKRNMKAAGFEVERLQGPPGKREMTRATRPQ